ncbi:MAG: hypothetical protein EOS73_03760 [Mesorhizobium sp.]|uniref:hypothetical protein n=1 Tax=Mesorhizobium sp. M7A.F.Ca.ET.027.02.1.1 TaxID=2496655 RepID=UPI000FD3AE26|nr:hypothetical protein [Mesorhizobium sp. M7A.F.Ca.ET.027.02.1.1]RVD15563.1 hypothetical protein EN749_15490 [Mesorhizobium sp. M7A.F.Ca.ET.027.02.1.1]RWD12870.1 MAG: hypothetical protein EOS73_03760 [Mesorhizobium sp.]
MTTLKPTPGHPKTYQRIPNDHFKPYRRGLVSEAVVLVPINDPKRGRMLFAKVEERAFDNLPGYVRNMAWAVVMEGKRANDMHFSVRVGHSRDMVVVSRLIMGAQPGERVLNLCGDPLDLRSTNLRLKKIATPNSVLAAQQRQRHHHPETVTR